MNLLRKKSKKRINAAERLLLKTVIFLMAIGVVLYFVSGFDFSSLQTTFYSMRSYKVNEPIRVVLLTDLHLREFGEDNSELLSKVSDTGPDIIAVAGDMTIKNNPDHDVAIKFLTALKDIAPVYYSYGNHEFSDILFTEGCTLQKEILDTGITVLDKSYKKINIKGTDIAIGGICISPENFSRCEKFMGDFCKLEEFKILLCHHPECFEEVMEGYPVDLALSGHAHGGQIILPIVGPLYTPDQGLFPKLTSGIHFMCGSTVVISRGLGNSSFVPRYNNDPEIVVIDIGSY